MQRLLAAQGDRLRSDAPSKLAILSDHPCPRSLASLDLSEAGLRPQHASLLASALRGNTALVRLELARNPGFGDEGVELLAPGLRCASELESLGLESTGMSDKGGCVLAAQLRRGSSLKCLRLGHNRLGDECAVAMANALELAVPSGAWDPQKLALQRNRINDRGAKALQRVLMETGLTELDLRFNLVLGEKLLSAIQDACANNQRRAIASRRAEAALAPAQDETLSRTNESSLSRLPAKRGLLPSPPVEESPLAEHSPEGSSLPPLPAPALVDAPAAPYPPPRVECSISPRRDGGEQHRRRLGNTPATDGLRALPGCGEHSRPVLTPSSPAPLTLHTCGPTTSSPHPTSSLTQRAASVLFPLNSCERREQGQGGVVRSGERRGECDGGGQAALCLSPRASSPPRCCAATRRLQVLPAPPSPRSPTLENPLTPSNPPSPLHSPSLTI